MDKPAFQFIYTVDRNLPMPIYLQLVKAVVTAIQDGYLRKGQLMPSINILSSHYCVTRSTIEKGYTELRDMGILSSHRGKGFFVEDPARNSERRVLFLFNALRSYQQMIFDAFSKLLGTHAAIDMVIYDNDPVYFTKVLKEKRDSYAHYLIVPGFSGDSSEAYCTIDSLPSQKLILLENHGS